MGQVEKVIENATKFATLRRCMFLNTSYRELGVMSVRESHLL